MGENFDVETAYNRRKRFFMFKKTFSANKEATLIGYRLCIDGKQYGVDSFDKLTQDIHLKL